MSLFALCLIAVSAGQTNSQQPRAVVLNVKGKAVIRAAGTARPVKKGTWLTGGATLVVSDQSRVLLLYQHGRYSRVQGPARVEIRKAQVRSANALQKRLAASFRQMYVARRSTVTVGGVRKEESVRVVSPVSIGLTPRKLRLSVHPVKSEGRRRAATTFADEVEIVARHKGRKLFALTIDEIQEGKSFLQQIDMHKVAAKIGSTERLELEVRFLEINDGEPELLLSRRQTFQLATREQERELRLRLQEIDRLPALPPTMRAILRIDALRESRFFGEATVEALIQRKLDPANPIWERISRSLSTAK